MAKSYLNFPRFTYLNIQYTGNHFNQEDAEILFLYRTQLRQQFRLSILNHLLDQTCMKSEAKRKIIIRKIWIKTNMLISTYPNWIFVCCSTWCFEMFCRISARKISNKSVPFRYHRVAHNCCHNY